MGPNRAGANSAAIPRRALAAVRTVNEGPKLSRWVRLGPPGNVSFMSAFHPIATESRTCRHFGLGSNSAASICAVNYPALIKLASIRIWLRANESAP